VDAAAIPVNYLTALIALYRMTNVTAGETVLIHGAGGGVGIAATQLARLRGARIIGTPPRRSTTRSASTVSSTRSTTGPRTSRQRCGA